MADVNRDQTPLSQSRDGWLARFKHWVIGRRDPVQAQLHEVERQGRGMARLMHAAGYLMLILFSAGSAIGICGTLVQRVIANGPLTWQSLPNDIVITVSLMLVFCMDLAAIYAAFMMRLHAMRQSPWQAYIIHVGVLLICTVLEGGTFISMSFQYDNVVDASVALLIIGRGVVAPLLSVYLNMARAIPVGVADMMYHSFLGAAHGLVNDLIHIGHDHEASVAEKAEFVSASAKVTAAEQAQLDKLIAVAEKRDRRHLSALAHSTPRAIVRASYVAPEMEPQEHSLGDTYDMYRAMHEGFEETDYPITDEVYDEVDEEDGDLFSTMKIPAVRLESALSGPTDTTASSHRARTPKHSGPARSNSKRSASMREFNRKLKSEAKAKRRADIRDAVYAILDEWHAEGEVEQISDKELARRVAARVNFDVNPSGNTVARWRGPWRSSRTHKAEVEREAQEQDSASIVADDIVAMLEQEHEEALV